VKERFFRELKRRTSKPSEIVSIYDAAKSMTFAYIAMEFRKGKDLVPFTKPDKFVAVAQGDEHRRRVSGRAGLCA